MQCNHCPTTNEMRDWSYHEQSILEPKIAHFYCNKCGSHFWKDAWYTAQEWFFMINEISYQEWQHQQQIEAGLHVHEQINHSDPEK